MQPRITVIDRYSKHRACDASTLSLYSECRIDTSTGFAAAAADPADLTILYAAHRPLAQLLAYRRHRPRAASGNWLLLVPRRIEPLARAWSSAHGDRVATVQLDPRAIAAIARGMLGLARRSSPRLPVSLMVRLFGPDDTVGLRGRTVNVSGSGMLLHVTADLSVGDRRRVSLNVGASPEPITLLARILRRDDSTAPAPSYGLCFERLLGGQPQAFERAVGVPLRPYAALAYA